MLYNSIIVLFILKMFSLKMFFPLINNTVKNRKDAYNVGGFFNNRRND